MNLNDLLYNHYIMVFGVRGRDNECLVGQIINVYYKKYPCIDVIQDMTATYDLCNNTNMTVFNGGLSNIPLSGQWKEKEKIRKLEGLKLYKENNLSEHYIKKGKSEYNFNLQ
ncbi:MAG: hypothetical protein ACQESF_04980 [Nanobdellota archaeon]